VRTGTSACRGVILPGRRFPARRLAHATYRHKYFSPRRVSKPRNLPSPAATPNRTEKLALHLHLLASPERTCKQLSRRIRGGCCGIASSLARIKTVADSRRATVIRAAGAERRFFVARPLAGGGGGGGGREITRVCGAARPPFPVPRAALFITTAAAGARPRHNFVPARPLAVRNRDTAGQISFYYTCAERVSAEGSLSAALSRFPLPLSSPT